jgi:rod shape-determining protein MreC
MTIALMATVVSSQPWAAGARGALKSLPAPLESVLTRTGDDVSGAFAVFGDIAQLRHQNTDLINQAAQLRQQNAQLLAAARENAELRAALDFQRSYGHQLVSSQVIGHGPDAFSRTLVIDRGTSSGVRVGDIVVSGAGLVGRVSEAGGGSAIVQTLADPNARVNAYSVSSGLDGTLAGGPGALALELEPKLGATVASGEWVMTSGIGGGYPRGLVIGQVAQVVKGDSATAIRAWVAWTNDPTALAMVMVIKDFTPAS